MDLKFRTLRPDEISVRVNQISAKGLSLLLYKDARCDMDILDETVGPMCWERKHSRDNANCTVSIYDKMTDTWVSKEDTGTESNTEKEKGLASDSFKRACVNWGIGRELYTAPFIYITADKCNIQQNQKTGKPTCYDRFEVETINYGQSREITALSIARVDRGKHVLVYSWGTGTKPEAETTARTQARAEAPQPEKIICERCGNPIQSTVKKDGSIWNASDMALYSKGRYKGIFCADCMKAIQKAEKDAARDMTATSQRGRMADLAAEEYG